MSRSLHRLSEHINCYWGNISREEGNERLENAADGSYLIRDSTSQGELTLVLRKNGMNKSIKILNDCDKYGFVDPCEFKSVADLIEFYTQHSLVIHNVSLDTKLLYPICVTVEDYTHGEADDDNTKHCLLQLIEANRKYLLELRSLELYHKKFTFICEELERSHIAIEALNLMQEMLKEQQELLQKHQKEIRSDQQDILSRNFSALVDRRDSIDKSITEQNDIQKEFSRQYQNLDSDICSKKPEIKQLQRKRENLRRQAIKLGVCVEYVDGLLLEDKNSQNIPHRNDSSWFVQVDKITATSLLQQKPHGTFLIRPKDKMYPYALSIKCQEEVKHCVICYDGERYGFTLDRCLFLDLTDLILKHRHISLAVHSDKLDVRLIYPLNAFDYSE